LKRRNNLSLVPALSETDKAGHRARARRATYPQTNDDNGVSYWVCVELGERTALWAREGIASEVDYAGCRLHDGWKRGFALDGDFSFGRGTDLSFMVFSMEQLDLIGMVVISLQRGLIL
jgi:hypothetical protein